VRSTPSPALARCARAPSPAAIQAFRQFSAILKIDATPDATLTSGTDSTHSVTKRKPRKVAPRGPLPRHRAPSERCASAQPPRNYLGGAGVLGSAVDDAARPPYSRAMARTRSSFETGCGASASATTPMPSSLWPGAPILSTRRRSRGAANDFTASKPTGTPPAVAREQSAGLCDRVPGQLRARRPASGRLRKSGMTIYAPRGPIEERGQVFRIISPYSAPDVLIIWRFEPLALGLVDLDETLLLPPFFDRRKVGYDGGGKRCSGSCRLKEV
jgi:hypothetical protein